MFLLNKLGLKLAGPAPCTFADRFQIDDVTIVNPMHGRRARASLEIASGSIATIEDAPANTRSEFAGCFVLPGLIDMHVHLPPDNALRLTGHAGLLYIAHGVTSVREAGDLDGTAVPAARRLLEEGAYPVPRVFSCGPFVGAGKATFKNTILLEDESEAEAAACRVKMTGATFMKLYDGLTEAMIRALERACVKNGLKVMGHVPSRLTYEEARIPEVQHFFGVPDPRTLEHDALINRSCDWHAVDERRMDNIVEATLRHNIANTPTIVTNTKMLCYRDFAASIREPIAQFMPPFYADVIWHPQRGRLNNRLGPQYLERQVVSAVAKKKRLTKKLFDAGAQLFLGTDVAQPFVVPGVSLIEEMAIFVDAGISVEQVWRLATRDAGERLGLDRLGQIEAGAPADLLVFRRDPTHSMSNVASLEAVIARGRLYRTSDLQQAIRANQAYYASPLIKLLARRGAERAMANALRRG